jgi:hypothetical protein
MALQPFFKPWPLFQFLDLFIQSIGHLGRGISPSKGRYLHTGQHKHRINAHASMPQVGFQPTIPVFERARTVHALDRASTAIGKDSLTSITLKQAHIYVCPPSFVKSDMKSILLLITQISIHQCWNLRYLAFPEDLISPHIKASLTSSVSMMLQHWPTEVMVWWGLTLSVSIAEGTAQDSQ